MEDWEWILQVNVLGLVRGVRAFVPAMVARGSGHVVNTASVAGTWAYTWDAAPYITSKFAAYGFSEALARTLRPQGVGVTVLCPGLVTTNLAETARQSGVPADRGWRVVLLPAGHARAGRAGRGRHPGGRRHRVEHLRRLHARPGCGAIPHLAARHRDVALRRHRRVTATAPPLLRPTPTR